MAAKQRRTRTHPASLHRGGSGDMKLEDLSMWETAYVRLVVLGGPGDSLGWAVPTHPNPTLAILRLGGGEPRTGPGSLTAPLQKTNYL